MSEETTKEMKPTIEALNERIRDLEKLARMNVERVETYTREKPMQAVGMAFLAGAFVGFVAALIAKKDRD